MTAVLNSTGQIDLPPEAAAQFQPGEHFELMISTSGNLILRRERPHQRSLMQHFQALNGLEIKRRRDVIPSPPEL